MLCQSVVAGDFLLAKYSHRELTAGNWYEVSRVDYSYPSQIPRYYLVGIADSFPWHPYWFGLTDKSGLSTIVGAEAHIRRAGVSCVPDPEPTTHPGWHPLTDSSHVLRRNIDWMKAGDLPWESIRFYSGRTIQSVRDEDRFTQFTFRCLRSDAPSPKQLPDDGGHAFSMSERDDSLRGMSLRDYFAGCALTGWLAGCGNMEVDAAVRRIAAFESYAMADEMLKAKSGEKRNEQ